MHYQINEYIIKSENAALSTKQINKRIVLYLSDLPSNITVLDYGCGKCRYSKYMNKKASKTVLIDSEIQISRKQRICDEDISVVEYAKQYLVNAFVYAIEYYNFGQEKFDFILCANVLSAIPILEERMKVLRNISKMLKPNGCALISVQYSNSYFNTYKYRENAIKHGDGWIIKKGKSYSFYGIILPGRLIELCENCGLQINDIYKHDGTIYLTVETLMNKC